MPRGCTPRKRRADDHRPGTACTPVSPRLQQLLAYSTNRSYNKDQGTERSGFLPPVSPPRPGEQEDGQAAQQGRPVRHRPPRPPWPAPRGPHRVGGVPERAYPDVQQQVAGELGGAGMARRRDQFRHRAAGKRAAGELVTPQCCLRDVVLLAPPCRARLRGSPGQRVPPGDGSPASRARGRPGGMPVCHCIVNARSVPPKYTPSSYSVNREKAARTRPWRSWPNCCAAASLPAGNGRVT